MKNINRRIALLTNRFRYSETVFSPKLPKTWTHFSLPKTWINAGYEAR
jgi:hypothetical protein